MKTIFCIIPMTVKSPAVYKGHPAIANDEAVIFPINGVLSKVLKKDEEVKVVLLKAIDPTDPDKRSDENEGKYKAELACINEKIGAKILYDSVAIDFTETRKEQENLLKGIVDRIDEGADIYADITYGPKSMPIILFYALGFAERFLSAEVWHIVYGKAYFDREGKPHSHEIIDMTSLYYLNATLNHINISDPKTARELLDKLLA